MTKRLLTLLVVSIGLATLAKAQSPYFYYYSGDDATLGVISLGVSTPVIGGMAYCSAPYFGQRVQGYFQWVEYPCSNPGQYSMVSYSTSSYSGPNPPPNRITQDGRLNDAYSNFPIARYQAYEECAGLQYTPDGYHEIVNVGECGGAINF
jgi:hypothetical protein